MPTVIYQLTYKAGNMEKKWAFLDKMSRDRAIEILKSYGIEDYKTSEEIKP